MTFGFRKGGIAIQLRLPGTSKVKIGLLQMSCTEQPQVNLEKAEDAIVCASKLGVQIICLQELFRSQYFCQKEARCDALWAGCCGFRIGGFDRTAAGAIRLCRAAG